MDRPTLPVQQLPRCRTRLRGHRSRRPGPHRAHRPGRDHRHRGPPARLRRPDPRHRRQPRLRLHRLPETRRPGTRPPRRPPNWPGTTRFMPNGPASPPRPPRLPRRARRSSVLAAVLDHDGQQHSATQTRSQALADADHLALLHAIWTAETTPAREQRYRDLLAAALPPGHHAEPGHQGPVAMADPARRRTRRPGPRPSPRRRDRRTGPRRCPRHPGRHRRPHPEPARHPGPAPGRAVVRARPRHRRPRTPRLRHPDRRADGRPQGTPRRARRRMRAALGGQRARPGAGASGRPAGLAAPGRLHRAPGGSYPATTTPPTRSDPNPPRPPRTCAPPGTRP